MNAQYPRQSIVYDHNAHTFAVTLHRPTHAEAEIAYLRAANPELARKVERLSANIPELATRARHAALLLLTNTVTLSRRGDTVPSNGCNHPVLAHVRSGHGRYDHLVTRGDLGVVLCDCPDANPEAGDDGAPATRMAPHTCKHILAASFLASK
jgi:hypothetical protein